MKFTANILAFYLLLGSFIPRTDFSQLLRLKDLQEHYQVHTQEAAAAGISFTLGEFLYDHFVQPEGHKHSNDQNQHQNLPLQTCSVSVLMAVVHAAAESPPPTPGFDKRVLPGPVDIYRSIYLSVIDHPPC